ncbi:MAG: hypothetical protein A3204_05760 [Candidatus Methanarcanum hacksteinii]|nr:MAG: hypothetical protein A3204_05760 [Candidatus Methanarcanum hacksteinii]
MNGERRMEKKMKILAFAAVALMFAVCFIGFVAINDDAVDADGTTTTVDKGPLKDMKYTGTMAYDEKGVYTLSTDVIVTLTDNISMKGVKFVGEGHSLTIKSSAGGPYKLDVEYDFGNNTGKDAGRIFQVSTFVLDGANLKVIQKDTGKSAGPDINEAECSVFGTAKVTVKNGSEMTITTNKYANRVFYNNASSLTIETGAKVILERASSSTVSLSMTGGATLFIKNPLSTAGNFYPNIDGGKITVEGAADGNHGLFFYGSVSNAEGAAAGVLKNCAVKTDGIVGFYSHKSVDATESKFEAKELVVAKSVAADMADVKGATFNVTKVGALNPNDGYKPVNDKKLYLNGVTFNGNTVIGSGASLVVEGGETLTVAEGATISVFGTIDNKGTIVNNGTIIVKDAAGLKTAVAAGGKISLANDVEITDHDSTGDKNGLKITKCVNITGNGYTIKFSGEGTIYGFVFSNGCNGSTLSNVSLDFGKIAKYGLCIRDMSEGNDGITIENVTIDNYGKTGIDLNGVYGKIKLKNVDVKGNGHYVDTVTNLTRGHGYALVIDDIRDGASFTTENCTITSVNVHNFCGKIHSVDLSGCNGLLFVSVEDGSTKRTSVLDTIGNSVSHNKQNGKLESIIGENGLLKDNIVTFPVGFNEKKYAIFDTVNDKDGNKKTNGGSFEVLRAYRVCYGMAFFDANVKIVKDYTINCDVIIPNGVSVLVGKDVTLTITKDSTLTGTINGPGDSKLTANGMKAGEGGITITGGSLIINGKIMNASGSEAGATVTVSGGAIKINGSLEAGATMVIEENTTVTVENGKSFSSEGIIDNKGIITNDGVLTNNGTIKMTGASNIAGDKKVVNNGIVIDERAEDKPAVPITNDGTVVAKNNADEYKKAKIDVVEQDPDKRADAEGKIEVSTNKYAFITPITTTGKLDIVMNNGQYTVTIPEGTTIAAGTVISVSLIEYQSDSVTRYQINTPGIENFSMKLPCQVGFKKAKVYCDDSEMGVSKVRYDAGAGYVTFDASHNSVFTIVLSNTSHAGTTTVSGGDTTNDYSLVIAFVVLVASLGFLAYVIKRR